MELYIKSYMSVLLLLLLFLHKPVVSSGAQQGDLKKQRKAMNNSVSAIYVFGDSTVDPGNNNYINTAFRGNFHPYGQDFENQTPTGRFTNGRLATDFLASYVGVKEYVPPYLDPNLSIQDLLTGVSFASAGSGFDPLTAKLANVIDMPKQLEYFKEYKRRVESAIGKAKMEHHLQRAAFFISAGTNDFFVNYFTLRVRSKTFTISAYQQFILQKTRQFLQGLREEGARKIAVAGLPPIGCLPAAITLNSVNALLQRGCIDRYSSVARQYNLMLKDGVNSLMHLDHLGAANKVIFIDIYAPLADMIQGNERLGFDEVNIGCCGSGYLEVGFFCNPKSVVCGDPSKYVFWDSIHPTEKTYYILFNAFRSVIDVIAREY